MTFDVPAQAYGRFKGRFSEPLAVLFADWAGVHEGQRALVVGCEPGAFDDRAGETPGPRRGRGG